MSKPIEQVIAEFERDGWWFYDHMHDEAKKSCEQRALSVYFRYRAIFTEWLEENLEPSAECVLESLRDAEKAMEAKTCQKSL